MDPRDALLKQALESLYWWGEEHGCCRDVSDPVQLAIYAHLVSVGVPVETYAEWVDNRAREHDERYAAVMQERDRELAAWKAGGGEHD